MAQGKMKNKVQKKDLNLKNKKKGTAFTKRANAPMKPKKSNENIKLKQIVTKNLTKTIESEMRSRAKPDNLKLSKAQEAVKKHTKGESEQMNVDETASTSTGFP